MRVSTFVRIWLVLCLGAVSAAACGGSEPTAPPVATAAVKFSRPRAALGSPIEVTYRFQVAADAPTFTEAYVLLATVYYRLQRREDGDRVRGIIERLNAEAQAQQPGSRASAVPPAGASPP